MYPAIFLDRDGVIIENRPNYVRNWADVFIFPQALAALAQVKESLYKIVILTNQAGIGKGLIPYVTAEDINRRLLVEIEKAGGRVDGIFMCPHTPQDGCECRKPKPGLVLQAARELSIDLSQSMLIGDKLSDLQAGQDAGVKTTVLVRTGLGAKETRLAQASSLEPFLIFNTLAEALDHLIP